MSQPQQLPGGLGYYAQGDAERAASQHQQRAQQLEQARQAAQQRVATYGQQLDGEYEGLRQQVAQAKAALSGGLVTEGQQVQAMQQRYQNPNAALHGPLPMPAYAGGGQLPTFEGGGPTGPPGTTSPMLGPQRVAIIRAVPAPGGGQQWEVTVPGLGTALFPTLEAAQATAQQRGWATTVEMGPPAPAAPAYRPADQARMFVPNVSSPAPPAAPAARATPPAGGPAAPAVTTAAPQPPQAAASPAQPGPLAGQSLWGSAFGAMMPGITQAAQNTPVPSGAEGSNTFQQNGYTIVQYGGGYHSLYGPDGAFIRNYVDTDPTSPVSTGQSAPQPPGTPAAAFTGGGAGGVHTGTGWTFSPGAGEPFNPATDPPPPGTGYAFDKATRQWLPTQDAQPNTGGPPPPPSGAAPTEAQSTTGAPQPPAQTGMDPAYEAAVKAFQKQQADQQKEQDNLAAVGDAMSAGRERPVVGHYAAGGALGGPPMPPMPQGMDPSAIVGEKKNVKTLGYRMEVMIPKAMLSQLTYSDHPTGAPLPDGMAILPIAEDAKQAMVVIRQEVPKQAGVPAAKVGGKWQAPAAASPPLPPVAAGRT